MKTIVLESPRHLAVRDAPPPAAPGPGEVLVRVLRVGICGTDIHAYEGRQAFIRYPVVPGHELAVEVLQVGPPLDPQDAVLDADGAAVTPGRHAAVLPYLADGVCPACLAGRPNCCASLAVLGVHVDGGLRERMVLPARQLLMADDLDPEALALVEMLAVGAHAVRRAALQPSDTVLVLGAGPIGLGVLAFAQRQAARVLAYDLDPARLEVAQRLGGLTAVASGPGPLDPEALRALLGGCLPEVVIDATGHRGSMEGAAGLVEHAGRLVFVGHTAGELVFANPLLHGKELSLHFSRNAAIEDFREVLQALRRGDVDAQAWINARVAAERLPTDFAELTRPGGGLVKAVVHWTPPVLGAVTDRKDQETR